MAGGPPQDEVDVARRLTTVATMIPSARTRLLDRGPIVDVSLLRGLCSSSMVDACLAILERDSAKRLPASLVNPKWPYADDCGTCGELPEGFPDSALQLHALDVAIPTPCVSQQVFRNDDRSAFPGGPNLDETGPDSVEGA